MSALAALEQAHDRRVDHDEIYALEMFATLRKRRWFIVLATVVCAAATFAITSLLPTNYSAVAILSPVNIAAGEERGAVGNFTSQLGNLAELAGMSVSGESKRFESLAVLHSQALIERYIQEQQLLPVLQTVAGRRHATLWMETEYFRKRILTVGTDTKTGLATLTITWRDPTIAARWANGLVQLANEQLRGHAIAESERSIAYLREEAEKTPTVQVRTLLYAMMAGEIRRAMIARGSAEYAFKVLDPALAPEKPSSLAPWLWTLIAAMSGCMLSVLLSLAKVGWDAESGHAHRP